MKACVHKTLTAIAIKRCGEKLSEAMHDFANEILRGVVDEDAITPKRMLNWHFYRSNEEIETKCYMIFNPTSEDIFHKRIKKMNKYGKDDKRRYNNLGRILHHIQDMSTPSHVIPIYHGPTLSLKDKLNIKDYFEEFMVKQTNTDTLGEKVILGNSQKDFNALYKDAAEATLEYIKTATFELKDVESDGRKKILRLNEFWQNYEQNENPKLKGFGSYGALHSYFLSTTPDFCNCPSNIADGELLKIHTYICNKAIQDTCDALFYASSLDDVLKDS